MRCRFDARGDFERVIRGVIIKFLDDARSFFILV